MNSKTTQIGGKGTVRRKKKRTGHIFEEKQTKESREYTMKIKKINKLIEDLDEIHYDLFKKYIEEEFEDLGNSIEKHNFLKLHKNEFEKCKDDPLSYVYSLFLHKIDKPIQFNPNSFLKFKKILTLDHLSIFIQFIYDTETALMKNDFEIK